MVTGVDIQHFVTISFLQSFAISLQKGGKGVFFFYKIKTPLCI